MLTNNYIEPQTSALAPSAQAILYLNTMFETDDYVCIESAGAVYDEENEKWKPRGGTHKKCAEWIRAINERGVDQAISLNSEAGAWIVINPTNGESHSDKAIQRFTHLLLEYDDIPKGKQIAVYQKYRLPIEFLVDSGGKSAHAILRVDADNKEQHNERMTIVYGLLRREGLQVDEANKNPSRFSRLPGVHRGYMTQSLLEIPADCFKTWNEWYAWYQDHYQTEEIPAPQESAPENITNASLPETAAVAPEDISIGHRHDFLVETAKKLRREGRTATDINSTLNGLNRRFKSGPVPDGEVKDIFNWVMSGLSYDEYITKQQADSGQIDENGFPPLQPFSEAEEDLPPFPVDCLPKAAADICVAGAESFQAPLDFFAMNFLGVASTALAGKYIIRAKPDWTEPINLYLTAVGDSGTKKSPVQKFMMVPAQKWENQQNEALTDLVIDYNSRIKALEAKVKTVTNKYSNGKVPLDDVTAVSMKLENLKKNPICYVRQFADDVTPERLASLMMGNKERMAIMSSEPNVFQQLVGLYNDGQNVNIDIYLKSYSCDETMVDRVGRDSIKLKAPSLTIMVMSQPGALGKLTANEVLSDRGILARLLYSKPKKILPKWETEPVPEAVKTQYEELIFKLLNIEPMDSAPEELTLSPEAYEEAGHFFYEIQRQSEGPLSWMAEWFNKLQGNVLRVAGILHICEHDGWSSNVPISLNTMIKAENIGRYMIEHGKAAFRGYGLYSPEETDARRYLKTIIYWRPEDGEMTVRNLQRVASRGAPREEMDSGLQELISRGYIKIEKQHPSGGKGGRPSEIIKLNPNAKTAKTDETCSLGG